MSYNQIMDTKWFRPLDTGGWQVWNVSIPPGKVVWSHKQQFILIFKDRANFNLAITLPRTFEVSATKVDNFTVNFVVQ